MKVASLILIALLVGDCIQLTKGIFKGQYWRITAINDNGTFDIKDRDWVLREVPGSFLIPANHSLCLE